MSFVIAAPEALDSAATDLVVLGSTLGAATAAAAAQTSTAYSG
ncbi:PE domain-containing protein, partial [Mycobacterium tuberculosis]